MEERDVIVIGGGSAGEILAAGIVGAGMSAVIVEERLVGGQCPFWACMPAKALLRPGRVAEEAAVVPGLRAPEIDAEAVFSWRDEVADGWDDAGHVAELESAGVELIRGRGRLSGVRTVHVVTSDGGSIELRATRAVVIGTGARPSPLPIEGAGNIDVWTSEDVTVATSVPDRMLVVGGGPVGLESAQAFASLGALVTIVEAEDRILPREDPSVGEFVAAALERKGLTILTGTTVDRLERSDREVIATLSSGDRVAADQVVNAMGRTPNSDDIGLDLIGLDVDGPIPVDDSLRVRGNEEWLFAIGDVNGRSMFTHAAKQQARVAASVISGSAMSIAPSERATPRCVFTDPAVAAAGLTEAEARSTAGNVEVTSADVGMLAEAGIWGTEMSGRARAIWMDGRLVGASFVGPVPLIEMLTSFQVAILADLTVDRLRHLVPQFPSFSELWLDLLPGST